MREGKPVVVFEVLYHVADDHPQAHSGAAGDGSFVYRTRKESDAKAFARGRVYYGKPAEVQKSEVSRKLASRWGLV